MTAGSEQSGQGNEGPARYVLDGNEGTIGIHHGIRKRVVIRAD